MWAHQRLAKLGECVLFFYEFTNDFKWYTPPRTHTYSASVSNGAREIAYASFKWFVFGFASSHQRTFDKTMSSAECQKQMRKISRSIKATVSYHHKLLAAFRESFRVIHILTHGRLWDSSHCSCICQNGQSSVDPSELVQRANKLQHIYMSL